jgi:hypothetical protein
LLELGLAAPGQIMLRLVKVQLPAGKGAQVLATSLMDVQKFADPYFW